MTQVNKKRVVIAGGSGFIGSSLKSELENLGYEVVILTRKGGTQASWDGEKLGKWAELFEGAYAVINLAGETVAQKWTLQAMNSIRDSRLKTTRVIGEAFNSQANPPPVWINASAIGYYGSRGEEELTENSLAGASDQFLPNLCEKWEAEARTACPSTTRLVLVRIGVALGREGGAFLPLLKLAKFFLGGAPGKGTQWFSWIHKQDLVRLIIWAVENHNISGPINAVAPNPVRFNEFCKLLRQKLSRPFSPNIPAFFLQLGTAFGAPDASLLLDSCKVKPIKAIESGFQFSYETVEAAIADLVPPK